ncbi:MAG: Fic family protein [Hyphomicrobiaceae bacterium]
MSESVFDTIASARAKLDSLRPLEDAAVRKLDEWYDVNFTYSSNALEGNTLTRNETAIVIEKGITVRGKPLKDHNEATDHYSAVKFMRALAQDRRAISEADIKQLHQMAVATTVPTAGQYATAPRFVTTADGQHNFPPPADIPPLMATFAANLPDEATPKAAFMAHLELVGIHPFDDGNGRTARLLMNAILLRGGYPPLMIDPADRADYIDAIETHQGTRDTETYLAFMGAQLLAEIENLIDRIRSAGG